LRWGGSGSLGHTAGSMGRVPTDTGQAPQNGGLAASARSWTVTAYLTDNVALTLADKCRKEERNNNINHTFSGADKTSQAIAVVKSSV